MYRCTTCWLGSCFSSSTPELLNARRLDLVDAQVLLGDCLLFSRAGNDPSTVCVRECRAEVSKGKGSNELTINYSPESSRISWALVIVKVSVSTACFC